LYTNSNTRINIGEKKKMPIKISSVAALFQLMFNSPGGWTSVWGNLTQGNYFGAFQTAVRQTAGLRIQGGGQANTEIRIDKTINPLDFDDAGATKVGAISSLALKIVKKYAGNPISGIPILSDLLSFS